MKGRLLVAMLVPGLLCGQARLKELASIEGVRDNQLVGYGLVVGLNGTGDSRQASFSVQSLANLLQRMGVAVPPTALRVRNTASVLLTATLPAFAQPGTRLDVTVAAIGDSTNLQGGLLILSPLRGADGQPYGLAQGPVVTGGFVAGRGGNSVTLNHPTTGRVPSGAIVERGAPAPVASAGLRLQLRQPDFTTASRVALALNQRFNRGVARAESPAAVAVQVPPEFDGRVVEFVAALESVSVDADRRSRVIINERTGTVTMGRNVRIRPVSLLHGGLTVEIQTTPIVSQPAPLSSGQTVVVPKVDVEARQERARSLSLQEGATVDDLVRALVAVGVTARDVVAILQNLSAAGALDAELEVI